MRRNRVFRDRNNSLEMYDDVALYDIVVLTIVCENNKVDELRNDLEYTEQHAAPCGRMRQQAFSFWWLRPSASTDTIQLSVSSYNFRNVNTGICLSKSCE